MVTGHSLGHRPPRPRVIFPVDLDLPPASPGRCTPKSSETASATLAGVSRRTPAKRAESLSNSSRSESIHNSPKSCPTPEVSAGEGHGLQLCLGGGRVEGGGGPGAGGLLARVGGLARPRRRGARGFLLAGGELRWGLPCLPVLPAVPTQGLPSPPLWGPARPKSLGLQGGRPFGARTHITRLVASVSMAEAGGAVRRGTGSGIEVPAVSQAGR